jgi:hypothetical protein
MTVSIDVTAFDDTELGAEVRSVFAMGATFVALYDGTRVDQRAATWVDGTRGLYKLRCENGHVWLSAISMAGLFGGQSYKQPDCTVCGKQGESAEDA